MIDKKSFNERFNHYGEKWTGYCLPPMLVGLFLLILYNYPFLVLFVTGIFYFMFGVPATCALVDLYLKSKDDKKDGD